MISAGATGERRIDHEISISWGGGVGTNTLAVWLKPADSGTDIPGLLRHDLEVKPNDRTGFAGWKVRPESVQMRVVGGHQALSAIADYTENNPRVFTVRSADGQSAASASPVPVETTEKMVEYPTWVRSPKTHAFFFGRAKAPDPAALQSGLDQLMATAVIP
jgi:hypothetical protein